MNKFDVVTGSPISKSNSKSYSKIFGETLAEEAQNDEKIVAVTAAMASGTGLDIFSKLHPKRCFDVGIAEQHAVTMSAGMATEGLKPFVAIYSTFLQRAYDQIIHDVAIQKLPVRFAIDRAGQVGADGATHAGSFDIAYLSCLPNFIIMAAGDENDLIRMIKTSIQIDDRPSSFRFPRGSGSGVQDGEKNEPIEIGKGRILKQGNTIALINLGARLGSCLEAYDNLSRKGFNITLIDARFAKPLDTDLLNMALDNHEFILTIEEGSIGGFSSLVLDYIHNKRNKPLKSKVQNIIFPDRFINHDLPENQYKEIGMDSQSIEKKILSLIANKEIDLKNINTI